MVFISSPGFAIAAITTGHVARHRYPSEAFGRVGLILGYVAIGMFWHLSPACDHSAIDRRESMRLALSPRRQGRGTGDPSEWRQDDRRHATSLELQQ